MYKTICGNLTVKWAFYTLQIFFFFFCSMYKVTSVSKVTQFRVLILRCNCKEEITLLILNNSKSKCMISFLFIFTYKVADECNILLGVILLQIQFNSIQFQFISIFLNNTSTIHHSWLHNECIILKIDFKILIRKRPVYKKSD